MPSGGDMRVRQGMLYRQRLHTLIHEGLQYPLLVLIAGPGYGKTQAMISYLDGCGARVFWMRLTSLDNLHTHFWGHLIRSLGRDFPDVAKRLQPLGFPDTLSKIDAFLSILEESCAQNGQVIWVFDDFGEIDNQEIKTLIRMMADAELDNFRLTLMSNALASTESIAFFTNKRSLILDKDLRFDGCEISSLFDMHGVSLSGDELADIERYTEGWPLALHLLALHQREKAKRLARRDGQLSDEVVARMFEERFFSAYTLRQQKLLVKLSLYDWFTRDFAASIYDGDAAELEPLLNHAFVTNEPSAGQTFFHHLYRLFLRGKANLLTEAERRDAWKKAAEYCAASGRTIEAITCFRGCGDHAGMLDAIISFIKYQHGINAQGITAENAAFFLEHLDLLTPQELEAHPVADYLRALIYLNTLELQKAEALLVELEQRLLQNGSPDAMALLGDVYASRGAIRMMTSREDFGDFYKKAAELLPNGTNLQNKGSLLVQNNHSFSMADNRPGAKERMELAVQHGERWISHVMGGGLSGFSHVFSAEAAYLSYNLAEAQQHAYRAIYKAEAHGQHDLVCNAYCILARIGLLLGDFEDMSRQVGDIADYAARHEISVLRDIRDTVLGWYYIKMGDHSRIPKSIVSPSYAGRPALAHDRSQIIYANYLIQTDEHAKLISMFERPTGLYVASGLWTDRIYMFIMLAISYSRLNRYDDAVNALWAAYDMCRGNGLIAPFIEAERHMRALIDLARAQKAHEFDPVWLDHIYAQAADFAKRAQAVRAEYRRQNPASAANDNPLTRREAEILRDLALGLTREEIAVKQYISVNTVKTFIRNIYNKLDAANRAEAVSIAISSGYMDVPAQG